MLEKIANVFKNLLLIGYPIATALGLIYAYQYYAVFDIQFLNFATPMDLLSVALANADKVGLVLILGVLSTIILISSFTLISLIYTAYALVKTLISLLFVMVSVLLKTMILTFYFALLILAAVLAIPISVLLFIPLVCVYPLAVALGGLRWLVSALRPSERSQHDGLRQAYAAAKIAHPLVTFDRYQAVLNYPFDLQSLFWLKTKEVASDLREVPSGFYSKYIEDHFKKAKNSANELRGSFFHLWKTFSIAALAVFSSLVAYGSGAMDAEQILNNEPVCKISSIECQIATLNRFFAGKGDSREQPEAKAFIVPTLNIASLESLPECGHAKTGEGGSNITPWARKYVRATIRQDADATGPTNLPSCLVYVGATDSVQFLLDFGDGDPPPPDKGSAPPPVPLREKLGAELLSLVKRYEASSDDGERIARLNGREVVTKSVAVRVSAISEEDVNCLEQQIRDAGGSVESNFENSIFAVVPVEALRALAVSEAVWRVDPQRSLSAPPVPTGPIPEGQQDLKEDGE